MKNFLKNIVSKSSAIKVFWSSNRYLAGKDWDNFGDALVPLLITKICHKNVKWAAKDEKVTNNHGTDKVFFVIGSVLEQASENNIVWGAGVMESHTALNPSTYLAVRGPISYSRVLASGQQMEPVWGDPALLCPMYFPVPKTTQTGKIALIPHYVDYVEAHEAYKDHPDITVVDLKNPDIEEVIQQIASARKVFSSSLHGLIVAHAYGIRAAWVLLSEKLYGDDIKFNDYFMFVGVRLYKPFVFSEALLNQDIDDENLLADPKLLREVQMNLIHSCPFI